MMPDDEFRYLIHKIRTAKGSPLMSDIERLIEDAEEARDDASAAAAFDPDDWDY